MSERINKGLMALVCLGLAISGAASVAGWFDVRAHYVLGRSGTIACDFIHGGMALWLVAAISHGRNWARVSYAALAVLHAVYWALFFISWRSGGATAVGLSALALAVSAACVAASLSPSGRAPFQADGREVGLRAAANRWQCLSYWAVYRILCFGMMFWYFAYQGSRDWLVGCEAAAREGSLRAREDLTQAWVEAYLESRPKSERGNENTIREARTQAEARVAAIGGR